VPYIVAGFNTFDAWLDRTAEGRDHLDPTKIPWTALRTLLGQAFYGGRVDNLFDQRVMFSFLDQVSTRVSVCTCRVLSR
jgi:dynein heavy chain 1